MVYWKEESLQVYQHIQNCFRRVSPKHLKMTGLAFVLGLTSVGSFNGMSVAHAESISCSGSIYTVVAGDTLSNIASQNKTTWQILASENQIANPDLIFVDQQICIPAQGTGSEKVQPPVSAPVTPPTQPAPPQEPVTGTTESAPAPAAPQNQSVEGMITQVFGANAQQAINIARCESGLNPNATNSYSIAGSHAAGLFQILYPSTWNTTSQAALSPYDPMANIKAAHEIFVRDGYSWREWVCKG